MKHTNFSKNAEVYTISAVLLIFLCFFIRLEIMIFSTPVETLFSPNHTSGITNPIPLNWVHLSITTPKVESDNQPAVKAAVTPLEKSSVNKVAVLANSCRGRSNAKPVINSNTRLQAKSAFKQSASSGGTPTAGSEKAASAASDTTSIIGSGKTPLVGSDSVPMVGSAPTITY